MTRLTRALDNGSYMVDETKIQRIEKGYVGEAVARLAMFENIRDDLMAKQGETARELETLRLEGWTHSVKFRQLLANKLANSNTLSLFAAYGLR